MALSAGPPVTASMGVAAHDPMWSGGVYNQQIMEGMGQGGGARTPQHRTMMPMQSPMGAVVMGPGPGTGRLHLYKLKESTYIHGPSPIQRVGEDYYFIHFKNSP